MTMRGPIAAIATLMLVGLTLREAQMLGAGMPMPEAWRPRRSSSRPRHA